MILMFHYVADESHSSLDTFRPRHYCSREKLLSITRKFLVKNKKFVTYREYAEIVNACPKSKDQLICYTFDDATIDHYEVVAPTLAELGVTASFYPITKVLDVANPLALPIHQYQAASSLVQDQSIFADSLSGLLECKFGDEKINAWRKKFSGWAGLDDQNVLLVKRILEELSESQSQKLIQAVLGSMSVSISDRFESIIQRFYCGKKELKEMHRAGFEVGSHSHTHRWLGHLTADQAMTDIYRSIDVLHEMDVLAPKWTVCYPHGNWSALVLEKLSKTSACIGGLVMDDLALDKNLKYLTAQRIDISAL